MSNYKILVVEDDEAIRRGVSDALTFAGYTVTQAANGTEGFAIALDDEFDLLLLDIVLPGMSGLEIMERLQEERPGIPVILLTAKGAEGDRVEGLKLGADDYVVKPFSAKELLARIEAVLRRSPGRVVICKDLPVPGGIANMNKRVLIFDDGTRTPLTEREFGLLRYLGSHPGRVVSRDEILLRVWKLDPKTETRTIDMTIARLREKIRDKSAQVIQTVRSRGYQFIRPGSDDAVSAATSSASSVAFASGVGASAASVTSTAVVPPAVPSAPPNT